MGLAVREPRRNNGRVHVFNGNGLTAMHRPAKQHRSRLFAPCPSGFDEDRPTIRRKPHLHLRARGERKQLTQLSGQHDLPFGR